MRIKKGDKVKILLGRDKGQEGTVEYAMIKEKKVFVSGVNIYKRHVRKMGNTKGGIIDIPKPLDISNLALLCPNCNKATRVGYKIIGKEKIRICKKCRKEIK